MANSISTKDLYLCEDLAELQQKFQPNILDDTSIEMIIINAEMLYPEAEKAVLAGDEEMAYIYYFRYVHSIATARKKKDYKKEYYDKLIRVRKFKTAVEALERLTDSLFRRYKQRNELKKRLSRERTEEYNRNFERERSKRRSIIPVMATTSQKVVSARIQLVPILSSSQVMSYISSENHQNNDGTVNVQNHSHEIVANTNLKAEDNKFTNGVSRLRSILSDRADGEPGNENHGHVRIRHYSCLECPICFEIPWDKKIFQCKKGHMLCEDCSQRVTKCPQCNVTLTTSEDRIRNIAMEDVLQEIEL